LGYSLAGFSFGDVLFSMRGSRFTAFLGSMWFMPFFSTYGVSSFPLGFGYLSMRVFDFG
jgi:NADH-ubiquinone oxidoreductase chain 5